MLLTAINPKKGKIYVEYDFLDHQIQIKIISNLSGSTQYIVLPEELAYELIVPYIPEDFLYVLDSDGVKQESLPELFTRIEHSFTFKEATEQMVRKLASPKIETIETFMNVNFLKRYEYFLFLHSEVTQINKPYYIYELGVYLFSGGNTALFSNGKYREFADALVWLENVKQKKSVSYKYLPVSNELIKVSDGRIEVNEVDKNSLCKKHLQELEGNPSSLFLHDLFSM